MSLALGLQNGAFRRAGVGAAMTFHIKGFGMLGARAFDHTRPVLGKKIEDLV
jgi:hypothetical protein